MGTWRTGAWSPWEKTAEERGWEQPPSPVRAAHTLGSVGADGSSASVLPGGPRGSLAALRRSISISTRPKRQPVFILLEQT